MKFAVVAALALGLLATSSAQAQDATAGEAVFKKNCMGCHAIGEGAKNKVGPALTGVVGRTAGTAPDFKYSQAMIDAGAGGLVWTAETLHDFLADPRGYVKGTKMSFAGVKDETQRNDLIAYLGTFSAPAAQ